MSIVDFLHCPVDASFFVSILSFCRTNSRRHYLAISAPAIPPPPDAPFPGPGAYNVRDFRDAQKKYMSSAVFVSNTSRWSLNPATEGDRPGPCSYTPRAPTKQSFNFNFERKWLA